MVTVHLCLGFSDSQSETRSRSTESECMWYLVMSQWYGPGMETAATIQIHLSFQFCVLFSWAWVYSPISPCLFFIQMKQHCSQGLPPSFPSSHQQCLYLLWATCACLGRWGSWGELWVLAGMWERRGGLCWMWRTSHANLQSSFCCERKAPTGTLRSSHGDQEKFLLPTPSRLPSKAQWSSLKDLMLLWHLAVLQSYFWQYCSERLKCLGLAFVAGRVPSTYAGVDYWRVQAVLLSWVEPTTQLNQWNQAETCDLG